MRNAPFLPDQSGIQFIRTELETGLTFSKVAEAATYEGKKERNRANARKAYDAVLHFLPSTSLNETEISEVKVKLEELRFALQSLGENV